MGHMRTLQSLMCAGRLTEAAAYKEVCARQLSETVWGDPTVGSVQASHWFFQSTTHNAGTSDKE
jgi:hypothetical protein